MANNTDDNAAVIAALEAAFEADPASFRLGGANWEKINSVHDSLRRNRELGYAYESAVARVEALIRGHQ